MEEEQSDAVESIGEGVVLVEEYEEDVDGGQGDEGVEVVFEVEPGRE